MLHSIPCNVSDSLQLSILCMPHTLCYWSNRFVKRLSMSSDLHNWSKRFANRILQFAKLFEWTLNNSLNNSVTVTYASLLIHLDPIPNGQLARHIITRDTHNAVRASRMRMLE